MGIGSGRRLEAHTRSDATVVPDYYARLGVDPTADRAEIEAALRRKQPSWSMGTRNPKTRHANQLYLDEIPALRRALLSDPATRAAYDAELAAVQRVERDQKLDELQRRGGPPAAQGGVGAAGRGPPRLGGGPGGPPEGDPPPPPPRAPPPAAGARG